MFRALPQNESDINGLIHQYPMLPVKCISSSQYSAQYQCHNAINPSEKYHFCSKGDESIRWYEFHFYNNMIYLQNYSIQVPNQKESSEWYSPKSWELFGITKNGNMVSIDNVTNSQLRGSYKIITYRISNPGFYVGLRLVMNGQNYGGYKHLRLQKIDVFGYVKPTKSITCNICKNYNNIFLLIVIITIK